MTEGHEHKAAMVPPEMEARLAYKGSANLWADLEPIVAECGVDLFDLDIPGGRRGLLRVLIAKRKPVGSVAAAATAVQDDNTEPEGRLREGGVTVDDCARVSRAIIDFPTVDEFIPDGWTIEVSSPGINRRLQRPEHFAGAVGERVKLTVVEVAATPETKESLVCITGVISEFSGADVGQEAVHFTSGERNSVPFSGPKLVQLKNIRNAQCDFLFE